MLNAIDLFAGCGGLTEGLRQAGFSVRAAVELDANAARVYRANHPRTKMVERSIREVDGKELLDAIPSGVCHLLAGCPPCQGFSSLRRLNRKRSVRDERNDLVLDFLRLVEEIRPVTVMMENVPGLTDYYLFKRLLRRLKEMEYKVDYKVLNVMDFGVPQSRKRLVLVGSRVGRLTLAEKGLAPRSVRQAIGGLVPAHDSSDPCHNVKRNHSIEVLDRMARTPIDGGSWRDLPEEMWLACHKKKDAGFHDVYGRMKWDDVAPTITGGCLNPSKGRFIHPVADRAITPREAALLQSFPSDYRFLMDISLDEIAKQIGNALPPKFSRHHGRYLKAHLNAAGYT
ncbi:MAG: DNA cytosine methyltransferase [Flavobacteriales bacterium]|nr:DNA cytosine methyltransferase [Flavobacteriales bacterium]